MMESHGCLYQYCFEYIVLGICCYLGIVGHIFWFVVVFYFLFVVCFSGFLGSSGCLVTHPVDKADLTLTNPLAYSS